MVEQVLDVERSLQGAAPAKLSTIDATTDRCRVAERVKVAVDANRFKKATQTSLPSATVEFGSPSPVQKK